MDLRRLETFYWVAQLGSFSAAAERLNTTQPAISARMRQLESSLGVSLFEGNTRRMRLTAQGRDLVQHASDIVAKLGEIQESLGARHKLAGSARIGAIDTVAMTWLPRLIRLLATKYPSVRVELIIALSVDLRSRLDRELDVAFLAGPGVPDSAPKWPIGRVPMRWMASPNLDISKRRATPANLADAVIISHTRESDLFERTLNWFRASGVEPRRRFHECSSLATMISLTAGEVGVAVLPATALEREIIGGALRLLPAGPKVPDSEVWAVCPNQRISPVVAEIVRLGIELAAADPAYLPLRASAKRNGASAAKALV